MTRVPFFSFSFGGDETDLCSTGVGYAFQSEKGDVAGALVIALELAGVFARQSHPKSIHWVALVSFLVTLFAVLKVCPSLFFTSFAVVNPSHHIEFRTLALRFCEGCVFQFQKWKDRVDGLGTSSTNWLI